MENNFRESDITFLSHRGIGAQDMEKYRGYMLKGFPMISLAGNCFPGEEIKTLSDSEGKVFEARYNGLKNKKVLKFVPASGAASRMFQSLQQALTNAQLTEAVNTFYRELEGFAFSEKLKSVAPKNADALMLIEFLLGDKGLNYGALPKGSILFHKYEGGEVRTAFEEHFYEAKAYAKIGDLCHLHFTIPTAFESEIKAFLNKAAKEIGRKLGIRFEVETSLQKEITDSPAIYVDSEKWVRDEEGQLFFRPAGHGALLENINELDADIVFVKNIDNVVNENLQATSAEHKRRLAGILAFVQEEIFKYLHQLDAGDFDIEDCRTFLKSWLGIDANSLSEDELQIILQRPIRVCGMVKNQGEPGGGPFLVAEDDGPASLQIVEKAQIDLDNPNQRAILDSATHFNPVDLVLAIKDHKGVAYDLTQFSNPNTGMVVEKSYKGKAIKALELPGLWNGAMHNWNTVFVEVPLETFNPVKTVFDLLRPEHR